MYIFKEKKIQVFNAHNTSKYKPTMYDSWIDYWKACYVSHIHSQDDAEDKAGRCCHCHSTDNVEGAHVISVREPRTVYIVPLCHNCNTGIEGIFEIENSLCMEAPDRCKVLQPDGHTVREQSGCNNEIINDPDNKRY